MASQSIPRSPTAAMTHPRSSVAACTLASKRCCEDADAFGAIVDELELKMASEGVEIWRGSRA